MSSTDCQSFFSNYFGAADGIQGNAIADFTLVSNRIDGLVSYSTGTLDYYPQKAIKFGNLEYLVPANFSNTGGSAQYLFSDRPFVCPQCPGAPPTFGPYQPFSVTGADNLGVTITAPTAFSPIQTPTITLSLLSWGGAQFSIQAQCIAGMLYGVLNNNDVLVISLRNVRQKPRPPQ